MKTRLIAIAILLIGLLAAAGCSAPQCYPPNKIIGNKCCLDADDNGICDMDEEIQEEPETEEAEEQTEEDPEPQIQPVAVKPAEEAEEQEPFQYGKVMTMHPGEMNQYLTIDDWSMYRSSTDKGELQWMIFTVRNTGSSKLTSKIELNFEGARIGDYEARVKKEYDIPTLNPGEKVTIKQSMGIRFAGIDNKKKLTMSIYDKYSAPRDDLQVLVKEFTPSKEMDSLEIYTLGPPVDD